jgi:outer membrane protein assembly factor BamD (BamD/ComL family)
MKVKGLIIFAALGLAAVAAAETWRLTDGQNWQQVGQSSDDNFVIAAGKAKQFVSTGQTGKAEKAFAKLKADYPELAGKDYDAFVAAELLYSKRKYDKAAKAYDDFTDMFPQSPFFYSAMERQYQIATAYLGGYRRTVLGFIKLSAYEDGSEIMNKIADKTGDAPIAKNALTTIAVSSEKRAAYNEAYQAWAVVADKWPTGQVGADALLGMARSLELDYKGPKFDSKVIESSKSYYSEYEKRYPDKASELQVSEKITQLDEKLAEKELTVADYYARTDSYQAANIYYQTILDKWVNSSAAGQVEEKMNEVKLKMEKMAQASGKKKFNWKGLFL